MKTKLKLKPCDCKDMVTASKLNEQGIGYNDQSIMIKPNLVVLTMGHTEIKIPMARFKMFAEWYLEEQEIDNTENEALNIPDVRGSALIEWLENQRRIAIELKAPSGECELLFEVIKKVKEMQDKYYKQK